VAGIVFAMVCLGLWLALEYLSRPPDFNREAHMTAGWLEACQPNEIRAVWAPEDGWMARVAVDTQKRTLSGAAGNGFSNIVPYLDSSPKGESLSKDQVLQAEALLDQLPPDNGPSSSWGVFYTGFHIAYYHNGTQQIRHYTESPLPPAVVDMGHALKVWFVKWGDPGDPPHMEISK
jgi:hypothetical protein